VKFVSPPWKTVLIARQSLFRAALERFIALDPRFNLFAEADDAVNAREACLENSPDLVIIEVDWQRPEEFELIRAIRKRPHPPRILVVAEHTDAFTLARIDEAGVHGCVSKEETTEILEEAMIEVAAGATYFPAIYHESIRRLRNDPNAFSKILTEREQEILWHVASGLTNRTIAERLNIGLRSVETYRYRLMKKLSVKNAIGLIDYASRCGILPPNNKAA
jgi:DNA-binding NarL/FixJ family response regulator